MRFWSEDDEEEEEMAAEEEAARIAAEEEAASAGCLQPGMVERSWPLVAVQVRNQKSLQGID